MSAFVVSHILRSKPVETLRTWIAQTRDRWHGIKTEDSNLLEEFGLAHPNRLLYVPSSWKSVRLLAQALRPDSDDTFVDFGSGKGRVVMMMALRLRLKRILGVEISPELNAIADENLRSKRSKLKTRDVQVIACDATAFEIPADMTIAYFYSSFTGPIFHAVIEAIGTKLPRYTGKRLFVVLQRPVNGTPRDRELATNDEHLRAQSWLTLAARLPVRSPTGWRSEISIYRAFDHAAS